MNYLWTKEVTIRSFPTMDGDKSTDVPIAMPRLA